MSRVQGSTPPPAAQGTKPGQRRRLRPHEELDVLVRARYPILYVVTWEEERVERAIAEIAQRRNKRVQVWTCTQGLVKLGATPQPSKGVGQGTADPITALDTVLQEVDPTIYIFKDLHPFMALPPEGSPANVPVVRRLRDVAYQLRDSYKTVVIVSPRLRLVPELEKDLTVVDFGLPTVEDLNRLLDRIIEDVKDSPKLRIELESDARERLLHAARGLTLREAENVFAKTLVLDGRIDATDIDVVLSEKQQIIKKGGLLEYYETHEDFSNVGGLDNLKEWLSKRALAFSDRAAEFGLPAPRGLLLLGVQGCGKSLCAKAVSSLWKVPLLRFDMGRMFGSLVGSSEENVRRAIQTAEGIAPCILWVDEIEKAFAGSQGSAMTDGGTTSRVFGTFLTWLSEKTAPVFVIATANDISNLPPELLRKGRLDEIFFVDLPVLDERREVLRIHLEKRGRDPARFDLETLAAQCDGFSGAEVEEAIIAGLFDAFSAAGELDTRTVLASLKATVPLSKTMSEELNRLRTWAQGRARPASGQDQAVRGEVRRKIEF